MTSRPDRPGSDKPETLTPERKDIGNCRLHHQVQQSRPGPREPAYHDVRPTWNETDAKSSAIDGVQDRTLEIASNATEA
jgi:hypothetical protein